MEKRAEVVINGKFFAASLEGMPRVGRELCSAFDFLLDDPRYAGLALRIAVPRGTASVPAFGNIAVDRIGWFRGQAWEQIDFPLYLGQRYSLNFANTAPIVKGNGCVVVHDAQFLSSKASHTLKTRLMYGIITPTVARRYRTIVTVSNYARSELLAQGVCGRDDIKVIPNGVDHVKRVRLDGRLLQKFGLQPGGYALSNSYVHAHKNVRTLFEAGGWSEDRQLVLFGSSPRSEYIERGITVPPNVLFTGRVSDEELAALMSHARMFLFPSLTEGFGLPPLEAMTLRCPTICAAAGAMPETCGEAALFADPLDPQAWRAQIDRLWTDTDLRLRMAAAGAARADRYRWSTAARAYLDLIATELGVLNESDAPSGVAGEARERGLVDLVA